MALSCDYMYIANIPCFLAYDVLWMFINCEHNYVVFYLMLFWTLIWLCDTITVT